MKKRILSLTLCLSTCINYGYIYQIHVLRTWNTTHKKYHYVIALGDWHDKQKTVTHTQRAYLEQLVTHCDIPKTHIIVEDLSSNNCGRDGACGPHILNTRGGILGGFAHICHAHNISVENVEYRYCRVASLGPVLRASSIDSSTHKATCTMQLHAITQEVTCALDELKKYADPRLQLLVKNISKQTLHTMKKLNLTHYYSQTVHDYLQKHSTLDNRSQLLNCLLIFDSQLMDAKIIDNILKNPEKETIILIAGGTHTQRASEQLQKFNYELIYTTSVKQTKEYNLDQCVGATIIKGRFCYRPQPVNVNYIEKYINHLR